MGGKAPAISFRTLGGRTVELADLRGRVVVVTFEGHGCSGCRAAEAALTRAWGRFHDDGVVVMGVVRTMTPTAVVASTGTLQWPPEETAQQAFGVRSVPQTYVIGPNGRIVAGLVGPVSSSALVAQISMLLRQGIPDRMQHGSGGATPSTMAS
jgi:AhpC/TSA family